MGVKFPVIQNLNHLMHQSLYGRDGLNGHHALLFVVKGNGLEEELVSPRESVGEKQLIEGVAMRDPVKLIVNGVNGVSGHLILKIHVQV